MSDQEKTTDGRRTSFIGAIGNAIKNDAEEVFSTLGRVAGYLTPSVAAFTVDPKIGVATVIPAIVSTIALEANTARNGHWYYGDDRFDSAVMAGLPVAIIAGAVMGGIASGDMNTLAAGGIGASIGAASSLVTSACGCIGHYAGKAIGTVVDAVRGK